MLLGLGKAAGWGKVKDAAGTIKDNEKWLSNESKWWTEHRLVKDANLCIDDI